MPRVRRGLLERPAQGAAYGAGCSGGTPPQSLLTQCALEVPDTVPCGVTAVNCVVYAVGLASTTWPLPLEVGRVQA